MRILIWTKGLTVPDEIVEDVERFTFVGDDQSRVHYKTWDKTERTVEGIERVMVFD